MGEHNGHLFQHYCSPGKRYLKLLSVNFAREDEKYGENFARALMRDAREISDSDTATLLEGGWRESLVATWFIGYDTKIQYAPLLHRRLDDSNVRYVGKATFFALARFGRLEDALALKRYLDEALADTKFQGYQPWALGALMFVEGRLLRDDLSHYIAMRGGSWDQWAAERTLDSTSADYWQREIASWVNLAESVDE